MGEELLNPARAFIFRIVHQRNVAAPLRDGLHCRSSVHAQGPFVPIGDADLIGKRQSRIVDCPPYGTLADYVPFYFTPWSPMMLNIKTGHRGIEQRPMDDIVILLSSLRTLARDAVPFVFTDRHASLTLARFTSDLRDLDWIDWPALQARNFRRTEDAARFERYQAEALIHRHMPVGALAAIACYTDPVRHEVGAMVAEAGLTVKVVERRRWYP